LEYLAYAIYTDTPQQPLLLAFIKQCTMAITDHLKIPKFEGMNVCGSLALFTFDRIMNNIIIVMFLST